jgi:hypothetical protein
MFNMSSVLLLTLAAGGFGARRPRGRRLGVSGDSDMKAAPARPAEWPPPSRPGIQCEY